LPVPPVPPPLPSFGGQPDPNQPDNGQGLTPPIL
jgi:hypothetical protein